MKKYHAANYTVLILKVKGWWNFKIALNISNFNKFKGSKWIWWSFATWDPLPWEIINKHSAYDAEERHFLQPINTRLRCKPTGDNHEEERMMFVKDFTCHGWLLQSEACSEWEIWCFHSCSSMPSCNAMGNLIWI